MKEKSRGDKDMECKRVFRQDACEEQMVLRGDKQYPSSLEDLPRPPKQLYFQGKASLLKSRCVGIVGSRKTTEYGRWAAGRIAAKLAGNGITIISGLAVGIDAAAHRGALEAEGATIAVLGCGLGHEYPQKNRMLRQEIAGRGLVITEYDREMAPTKYTFPYRNRIIAAMAECIILVEAGLHSGALQTADAALSMNKPVYVVPGNINSACSFGSNLLIREGAQPLMTVDDILDYLNLPRRLSRQSVKLLGEEERKVFNHLQNGQEKSVDELVRELSMGAGRIHGIITVLEMKGLVYTAMGKVFITEQQEMPR